MFTKDAHFLAKESVAAEEGKTLIGKRQVPLYGGTGIFTLSRGKKTKGDAAAW